VTALAPGSDVIGTCAATAALTNARPGSLTPGVPASVANATACPARSSSTILATARSEALASSVCSSLPVMPR
jgi:hypothetical protein